MLFKTKEKLKRNEIKELNARLGDSNLSELIWLKLLTGFIDIEYGSEIIKQNKNYCVLGIKNNRKKDITLTILDSFIHSADTSKYFKNNRVNNRLFTILYNEVALYFIASYQSNHIEAFVHIYRVIEKMSIMFPLLYFKQSSNFSRVFNDIKNLVSDNPKGLKFYNNFQKTIFDDPAVLDTLITFNFMLNTPEEKSEFKLIYDRAIEPSIRTASYRSENSIQIPFGNINDLAIIIRNRYFHLSVEYDFNIEPIHLNMNSFFSNINENILNWIGVMYYEMFKVLNK